jgi:hypothetical protein
MHGSDAPAVAILFSGRKPRARTRHSSVLVEIDDHLMSTHSHLPFDLVLRGHGVGWVWLPIPVMPKKNLRS